MTNDFGPMIAALSAARRVLLTTHVRPDGDALGSIAALAVALKGRRIQADLLLLSKLPSKYRFVLDDLGLAYIDASASGVPDLAAFDTVVIADTGTFSQLPGLELALPAFESLPDRQVLIIDHHRTQEPWGHCRLIDTSAASATELIGQLLAAWGVPLTPGLAEALYVGVVSDTGWFAFSNTTPTTLRFAADLMDAGVDPDRMYQRLFQSEREPRLRLQARAMNSLKLLAGGRLAVLTLTPDDFAATGAAVPDTENLINYPLALASVEMSLLVTQSPPPDDQTIKISCRSKGGVDVARFAEQFGGGGHARASGLKLPAPLDSALSRLIAAAEAALAPSA